MAKYTDPFFRLVKTDGGFAFTEDVDGSVTAKLPHCKLNTHHISSCVQWGLNVPSKGKDCIRIAKLYALHKQCMPTGDFSREEKGKSPCVQDSVDSAHYPSLPLFEDSIMLSNSIVFSNQDLT